MKNPPPELLEFLNRYSADIQSLALGLRRVVHAEMGPCNEYIFEMRSKVVLLYGASEKVIRDGLCNINVFERHVTLAFPRGTDLKDADGLLQGTGKGMRHIRLKSISDVRRFKIPAYLRQARTRAGLRRPRRRSAEDVVTRVKAKKPAKRPPWPQTFW